MERAHFKISGVGERLLELLRISLERELDIGKEQIGTGIPGENEQLILCVYLYDIRRNPDIPQSRMVSAGTGELRYPSYYYDLYYMLIPYSGSDRKYRVEEEIRILDILLQMLGDTHHLNGTEEEIILLDMDFEEKARIWSGLEKPMRTALYCKIGPVEIPSSRRKAVKRVTDIRMDFVEKEKG